MNLKVIYQAFQMKLTWEHPSETKLPRLNFYIMWGSFRSGDLSYAYIII